MRKGKSFIPSYLAKKLNQRSFPERLVNRGVERKRWVLFGEEMEPPGMSLSGRETEGITFSSPIAESSQLCSARGLYVCGVHFLLNASPHGESEYQVDLWHQELR